MPDGSCSFLMARGVPVVTAPAEIDVTTTGQLRAMLAGWAARGHTTVVVDLASTQFCDCAGLHVLVQAHKQAQAEGGGLRLVLPASGPVPRIFTLTGLDRVIPHFTCLEQALTPTPAAATGPRRPHARPGCAAAPGAPAQARDREKEPIADRRECEQCGTLFVPRREHARFCCVRCRATWNRKHLGDPAAGASALVWSITAMSEATARLPQAETWDRARAYAAAGEAVWWLTLVDATLVRHHPEAYDAVLARQPAAQRPLIEGTLAGLRFVRNQVSGETGLAPFIQAAAPGLDMGNGRLTGWRWKPVAPPVLASLPARAQAWEMTRYQAYQAQLAGHTIGETFRRAATFLTLTATYAGSLADLANTDASNRTVHS